jgi:hypothetical protein
MATMKKKTKAELDAFLDQMLENAYRTRRLAEEGLAKREGRPVRHTPFSGEEMLANAERTRRLAEQGQAELDARKAARGE